MSYSVFVINLDARKDRWKDAISQENKLPCGISRIEAVTPSEVSFRYFTSANVAACWTSHRRAMEEMLVGGFDFALILEDDFEIVGKKLAYDINAFITSGIDFLQIGFLKTSLLERAYIFLENCYDSLIRSYGILEYWILRNTNSRKKLVTERRKLKWAYVLNDIRPGGHAYIVNRKAAEYFLEVNDPIFLSADDLFMAAGPMRSIKMARLRKSVVGQSGSTSSIRD